MEWTEDKNQYEANGGAVKAKARRRLGSVKSRTFHGQDPATGRVVCVSCGFSPSARHRSLREQARSGRLLRDFIPGVPPVSEAGIENHDIAVTESFQ